MNIRKAMFFVTALAAGYSFIRSLGQAPSSPAQDALRGNTPSPQPASLVVSVVEETLRQHEGEDTPFVHAFEEALEHEPGHQAASPA